MDCLSLLLAEIKNMDESATNYAEKGSGDTLLRTIFMFLQPRFWLHEIRSLKTFLHFALRAYIDPVAVDVERLGERLKMASTTNKGDEPTGLANLPICMFFRFPLGSYFVLSWEVVCLSKALLCFLLKHCQHSAKWSGKRGGCTFHGFYHSHFFTWWQGLAVALAFTVMASWCVFTMIIDDLWLDIKIDRLDVYWIYEQVWLAEYLVVLFFVFHWLGHALRRILAIELRVLVRLHLVSFFWIHQQLHWKFQHLC